MNITGFHCQLFWSLVLFFPPILLSIIPRTLAVRTRPEGGMLLPSRVMCLDPSWQFSRHISPAAKSTGRLPTTYFPTSPVASGLVGGTFGGVACVRLDFVEDMLSLLSLFLELARFTTIWPGLLPWNKSMAFCLNPLSEDFIGAVPRGTQSTAPNLLRSSPRLADLSYFALVVAVRPKTVFFLCFSPLDWSFWSSKQEERISLQVAVGQKSSPYPFHILEQIATPCFSILIFAIFSAWFIFV